MGKTAICGGLLIYGFSQLSTSEFFVFRKMEMCETKKLRVVQQVLIAQSPFQYNRGVQATMKERKGD